MRTFPAGAWIKTAEGWREIPGARPQVVFVLERRTKGPVDCTGWVQTGGRLARLDLPSAVDVETGYDWPETFGDDE